MHRTRRRTAGLLVGAMVLAGAACSAEATKPSELSDDPSTSASPPSSASTANSTAEVEAVIAVYKGFYDTISGLGMPTDADVQAAVQPYAESGLVGAVVALFQKYRTEGKMPGGHVTFSDISVTITGSTATISECRDGSTETLVDSSTGVVISTGGSRQKFEAVADKSSGRWLLSRSKGTKDGC